MELLKIIMEDKKTFNIGEQFRTFWPVALVIISLAAQWAILGQRVSALEDRVDRQGTSIADVRTQVAESQKDVAALNEKVDGVAENVNYIRSRIDNALSR